MSALTRGPTHRLGESGQNSDGRTELPNQAGLFPVPKK